MNRALNLAAMLAAAAALTASCSSNSAAPVGTVGEASLTSNPSAGSTGSVPVVVTADSVIRKFEIAKLPVGSILEFTYATDPNHLLGRPNGYTSKASWTDKRISADQAKDSTPGSVDLGGSVEIFTSAAAAQAREHYIQSVLQGAPILGTEYDYVVGDAVIRVSQVLTPAQAQAYDAAAQ